MIRKFDTEIKQYLESIPKGILTTKKRVSIATGSSAYEFMKSVANYVMDKIDNIEINVYKITNNFFGDTITVSGLITATDIIDQLKDIDLGDKLYIPRNMLKADEEIFLDNITLEELKERLKIDVIPCLSEGKDFIDKILD